MLNQNPKSEYRNSKQALNQNPKFESLNPKQTGSQINLKYGKSKTLNSNRPVWSIVVVLFFIILDLFRISNFEFVILFVLGAFAPLREIDPVRILFLSRQDAKQSLIEIRNEAGLERCNFGVIYYFVETQNLQCRHRATSGD